MAKHSDIEFLFVLATEHYSSAHNVSYSDAVELFHQNHVLEKMLVQHEYLHQVALQEVFSYVESLVFSEKSNLVLFHGSDTLFDKIDLSKSHDYRDFGKGFYTTVLESQAKEWAYRLSLRNGKAKHYVYRFSYQPSETVKVKHFDSMGIEWLDFIKKNRSEGGSQHDFGVVVGPVADDKTVQTVQLYLLGTINAEEAMNRLRYSKVNNQFSFHTEEALQCIKLLGRSVYE